jgi:hypothetical protein
MIANAFLEMGREINEMEPPHVRYDSVVRLWV